MSPLPLTGLNHVSRICRDVAASARFYSDVLGFMSIKRPSSFDFAGAWLFGFGMGIHLIKGEPIARPSTINPRAEHLSFQAPCLASVEQRLHELGVEYIHAVVEEDGIRVSQLFFHDPDNNMIEICDCHLLPVIPLANVNAAALCTSTCEEMEDLVERGASSAGDSSASSASCDDFMSFCSAESLDSLTLALHKSRSAAYGREGSSCYLSRSKSMVNFCHDVTAQRGLLFA